LSPETIYEQVWGQQYGDIATVAIHVQRLRKRIEEEPSRPRFIETIKGFGYRFNPDVLEDNRRT
jgi:DNA-binding response OmpR family regulator